MLERPSHLTCRRGLCRYLRCLLPLLTTACGLVKPRFNAMSLFTPQLKWRSQQP